jgi:tetratricopeptide (TPR) repeat protein
MKKISIIFLILSGIAMLALLGSCTSGGAGAMIRGQLQHNYGISVDNTDVAITINGVNIKADKLGRFYYRTEPGQYDITAAHADLSKGIALNFMTTVNLGDKELLDLTLYLRDTGTADGWALYQTGDYAGAIAEFQSDLNGPSGNDALNGLGWTTWMFTGDYTRATGYLHEAIKDVRNVEARIALCGIELNRVAVEGNTAFGRAYQNMCLALQEPDGFTTRPRHDAVGEGDMLALKALLGYISGDVGEAEYILANYGDELENETNAHGKDLLMVLENFMNGD